LAIVKSPVKTPPAKLRRPGTVSLESIAVARDRNKVDGSNVAAVFIATNQLEIKIDYRMRGRCGRPPPMQLRASRSGRFWKPFVYSGLESGN
jgi:hypothetical protein